MRSKSVSTSSPPGPSVSAQRKVRVSRRTKSSRVSCAGCIRTTTKQGEANTLTLMGLEPPHPICTRTCTASPGPNAPDCLVHFIQTSPPEPSRPSGPAPRIETFDSRVSPVVGPDGFAQGSRSGSGVGRIGESVKVRDEIYQIFEGVRGSWVSHRQATLEAGPPEEEKKVGEKQHSKEQTQLEFTLRSRTGAELVSIATLALDLSRLLRRFGWSASLATRIGSVLTFCPCRTGWRRAGTRCRSPSRPPRCLAAVPPAVLCGRENCPLG